jgi:hypothetical protein
MPYHILTVFNIFGIEVMRILEMKQRPIPSVYKHRAFKKFDSSGNRQTRDILVR